MSQCWEFKILSFCGTIYLYILVPAKARLTFPGAGRRAASSLGILDPTVAVRCGHGKGRSFSRVLPGAGSGEQRRSPVLYTLLSVLVLFLLLFLTSLLFVVYCSHLIL